MNHTTASRHRFVTFILEKIDNWTREREREKGDKVPVSAVFPLLFQAILSKGQRQNQREFVFPLSRAVPRKINAITCTFFFFPARGKKLGIIYHFNRRGSRWIVTKSFYFFGGGII